MNKLRSGKKIASDLEFSVQKSQQGPQLDLAARTPCHAGRGSFLGAASAQPPPRLRSLGGANTATPEQVSLAALGRGQGSLGGEPLLLL